jgi:hypothetical protein
MRYYLDLVKRYLVLALGYLFSHTTERDTATKLGTVLIIKYIYRGRDYKLYVPYKRELELRRLSYEVYTVKDGVKIPLGQQPGLPVLVRAEDIGVDDIVEELLD